MQPPAKHRFGSTVALGLLSLLLVVTAVFASWSFKDRQRYKNHSDQVSAEAVKVASDQLRTDLQVEFDEKAKLPYKTYSGPATYGTVSFRYPKTWSAYVDSTNTSKPLIGYFHPNIVPGLQSNAAFALQVQISSDSYNQVLSNYSSNIQKGTIKAKAYVPPKMVGKTNVQAGTMLTGDITSNLEGTTVIIKVRDKTLQLTTFSSSFLKDYNNVVLKSLTFIP